MRVENTPLKDVLIFEPTIFSDNRGFFFESWNEKIFKEATGLKDSFTQDNQSRSSKNVLRGLHYQIDNPQGKLIRVLQGEIYDVAVDLRRSSSSFGQYFGVTISGKNNKQLWIPPGFAHGFIVRTDFADVLYKTTGVYAPSCERCIRWDDPHLSIDWGISDQPILSNKDMEGVTFQEAEVYI